MNDFENAYSPAEREQLEQELMELHFGCHENPERIEARLAKEPALRALQEKVLQHANMLTAAVRPEQPRLELNRPTRANRWRWLGRPTGRLLAAAAIAATTVLGFFVAERVARHRASQHERDHLHVTVSAPRAVPAASPWTFTVQANDLHGEPVDCRVRWQAFDDKGAVLAANEAAVTAGTATIAVPADLRIAQRIEVVASHATDEVRHVLPLSKTAAAPLVHVTTDRPVYRPGEPVFVRAVVLDRVTRLPVAGAPAMIARLRDPKGAEVVAAYDSASANGVGSFVLRVPPGSAGGPHRVEVSSMGQFPTEVAEIVVRSFRPPQLRKTIVLDRVSYAPGARGSASVTAERLASASGAAAGASAKGALVIDGTEVWSEEQTLGTSGAATFRFAIPANVDKGAARFVATITDGGIVETEVKPFVVPTGKVNVEVFPEGGELIAGVENTVYLECTDPLGRPIDGVGELRNDREEVLARFRTEHQGRAKVAFVPRASGSYRVKLARQGEAVALPAVRENGIAVRLRGDDVAANAPLRIDVAGRGNGPWLLGVFCRGVLVGQTTLRAGDDGELRTTAEVELPPHAAGVLRATVFDRSLQPVAERLVRRLPAQRIDVSLTPRSPMLNPGDEQSVTVRTTDENGHALPAIVGLSVTDDAVASLGSEPRVGLVDDAFLFADVEKMENLGDFFFGNTASPHNVDLLLGTRGWRRFVWKNDDAAKAAIAARGTAGAGVLAREGYSHAPQVASNLAAAQAAMAGLERDARAAGRCLRDGALAACMLLALWLLVESIAAAIRKVSRDSHPWHGLPVAVVAVVALLLVPAIMLPTIISSKAAATGFDTDGLLSWSPQDFENPFGVPPADTTGGSAIGVTGPVRKHNWSLVSRGELLSFDEFDSAALFLGRAEFDPAANPLSGAFFNDGGDGDIRRNLRLRAPGDLSQGGWDDRFEGIGGAGASASRTRQYAHRHTATDDRRDFTPTIFWSSLVWTTMTGETNVSFATSDAVTTWLVQADAHAEQGIGRLGQAKTTFATQQPLTVEAKLPDEVSAGDTLQIPVSIVVTDPTVLEASLTATVGTGLQLAANAPTTVTLANGRGRALLPITAGTTLGDAAITIEVRAGRFHDRIRHTLRIAPRGFPHRRSCGGSLETGKPSTANVALPHDAVAGTGRVTLKVYPSPISALTEGLAGIVQEPHGCFEQASSSNYPNTLVLTLLDASGDDVPAVAARARELLPKGYAKITGYECKQKGYEWFGADPGHEALTAYGLLQFHDMEKVFDVDASMVERTKQWLLARRDGKGNYPHQGSNFHSFGGCPTQLTNAYVTYALLQAGTPAAELATEIAALVTRSATQDPYELALIACALHLAGRPEAIAARVRLAELQRPDGSMRGTTTSITQSTGQDLAVETTGFAILAWLPAAEHAANVRTAVEFVQRCRDARGTFGATQATITALRALTAYATAHRTMRTDGTLRVFEGDRKLAERAFTARDTGAITFELWDSLPPGDHMLRIEVDGGGAPLPWACDVSYNAEQPADDATAPLAITASLRTASVREGDTVAMDVTVKNTTGAAVPTPIAVIGIPAGLELPTRVLEDLQKANAFAAWELKGREVVFYWRGIEANAARTLTLDLVARTPGDTVAPASRAWPYYSPAQKRWAQPAAISVTPAPATITGK